MCRKTFQSSGVCLNLDFYMFKYWKTPERSISVTRLRPGAGRQRASCWWSTPIHLCTDLLKPVEERFPATAHSAQNFKQALVCHSAVWCWGHINNWCVPCRAACQPETTVYGLPGGVCAHHCFLSKSLQSVTVEKCQSWAARGHKSSQTNPVFAKQKCPGT